MYGIEESKARIDEMVKEYHSMPPRINGKRNQEKSFLYDRIEQAMKAHNKKIACDKS